MGRAERLAPTNKGKELGRTRTPERQKLVINAIKLRLDGWTERQISCQVGVSQQLIHKWLRCHNVPKPTTKYKPLSLNTVHWVNCLDGLRQLPEDFLDLVFADPPYNIGVDYGTSDFWDKWDAYYDECAQWFRAIHRVLKPGGSFYFMHGYSEVCAELLPTLRGNRFTLQRWLTWYHPTNIGQSPKNWTRAQRTILFCTKGSEPSYFDGLADPQPYRNPTDKRIIENLKTRPGVTPYDVWEYNLVKNVSKDKTEWPNQLPLSLVERIVKVSCPEGGIVCDPFMGSGTTAVAAVKNNRQWIGFDMNRNSKKETEMRLLDVVTVEKGGNYSGP